MVGVDRGERFVCWVLVFRELYSVMVANTEIGLRDVYCSD